MRYATGKFAWAMCAVCGFRCKYTELRAQYRYGKATGLRVCPDCVDKDVRIAKPVADAIALRRPQPDTSLEPSRRTPHWKPVDAFGIPVYVGELVWLEGEEV